MAIDTGGGSRERRPNTIEELIAGLDAKDGKEMLVELADTIAGLGAKDAQAMLAEMAEKDPPRFIALLGEVLDLE